MGDNLSNEKTKSPYARYTALGIFLIAVVGGVLVGQFVEPKWDVQKNVIDVVEDEETGLFYVQKGEKTPVDQALDAGGIPTMLPEDLDGQIMFNSETGEYYKITTSLHFGIWSLLPAFIAIGLCLATKEPLVALLAGIVSGAFMLSQWNFTDDVLLESLASQKSAGVLLLYLWLLGGLMGIWSRTGAAQAFAEWATRHFVRGPRSAKLVAWTLGVLFFQGGTVSTVLVGTCVKPIADQEKVSHEELSYVVDSTASPIAILLAFNAWPAYVQALIFVPGIAVLATESDRLAFFFSSLPLSFYAWFAVLGTFLLAIDKAPILGKQMRKAIKRARETGQLDRPGSEPMASEELQASHVPEGYTPTVWEFALPLIALIGVAVATYIFGGSPQVRWAFGAAVVVAAASALVRGMTLAQLMEGVGIGVSGFITWRHVAVLDAASGADVADHDHCFCQWHQLGHLCCGISFGDAVGMGDCPITGTRSAGVVSHGLLCGGTQRQRLR